MLRRHTIISETRCNDALRVILPLMVCAMFVASAVQPVRTLKVIAQTGDQTGSVKLAQLCGPAINDTGQVVFAAGYTRADGSSGNGVFAPGRMLVSDGDTVDGFILAGIGNSGMIGSACALSLNNAGTAVFQSSFVTSPNAFPPLQGIFTATVVGTNVHHVSAPPNLFFFKYPLINDSGKIVFFGGGRVLAQAGIYTTTGAIVKQGDVIDGRTLIRNFGFTGDDCCRSSLDESGDIAFSVEMSTGTGVFTQTRLIAGTGDGIAGKTLTGVSWPVTAAKRVAFVGTYSGGMAIFRDGQSIVATGSTVGGKVLTQLSAPAMNASGEIAFVGAFDGGTGVFTPDGAILRTGDQVRGKTVRSVGNPGINRNGSVVMSVSFTDGTSAVVVSQRHPDRADADVNGDGNFDCRDVAMLLASFGRRTGDPHFREAADVVEDGVVDLRDLIFVLRNLDSGRSCW